MSQSPPIRPPLAGVLSVFQTPYHADESIDYGTLEREIDWLFDRGADGIVMAMVSEVLAAVEPRAERAGRALPAAWATGAARSSSASAPRAATRPAGYARHAETGGADAVMAVPPIAVALGDEPAARLLPPDSARRSSIPVIVQDASGYVGRPMSIALQARLFDEFGPRVMFKPEAVPIGPRLSELHAATGGRARVFEGTGGIALVDSFRRGIVGTMPGADLIDAIVALWRALTRGDESGRLARLAAAGGAGLARSTVSTHSWRSKSTCWSSRECSRTRSCAVRSATCSTKRRAARSIGCSISDGGGRRPDSTVCRAAATATEKLRANDSIVLARRSLRRQAAADCAVNLLLGGSLGQADHAHGDPRTGVAGRLRFQIVGLAVNDDRAAQHVVQVDAGRLDVDLGDALRRSASMLPKSPSWCSFESGPPCGWPCGL